MTPAKLTTPFQCLVVDDDAGFAAMLADLLSEEGGEVVVCCNLQEARAAIARHRFELASLDNKLPDGTGFEFYPELIQRHPECVGIMITGAPELGQAVQLTRNGLFDYLTKPLNEEEFLACLARIRRRWGTVHPSSNAEQLIGSSPAMTAAVHVLRQAARHSTATVLLMGETGTGKDLAARTLHQWTFESSNPRAPYLALNCPAVPADMFEAELFGSEKGAYTGAEKRRIGLAEAAEGGTLFLDEVTEIPLNLQAKLLRFLESREYRPLGSTTTRFFTGRVVAATNRRLQEEVSSGRFREDLMYRLDVTSIRIPPLREHLADLDALAEQLLAQLCTKYGRRKPHLLPDDLQTLRSYHFPGNVRELRNLLERSLLRSPEEKAWMPLDLTWLRSAPSSLAATDAAASTPAAGLMSGPSTRSLPEQQEYELIRRTLQEEGGAIRRTATRLGLTHQALLRRLQKWPELRTSQPPSR
ncbi:MAG: sigma-54-dependent Fis family transcriptional regulator [Verrucomicrobiales bacterium]|nr:sigma-54-dependent Fis family transcriptional regulator [Verrucomicrobiales bacterium]